MPAEIARQFLNQHPDIQRVEFLFVDVNGVPRGKWANANALIKAFEGDFRLPRSSYVLDIWGDTAEGTGLLMRAGDQDGLCVPVEHSLGVINWLGSPAAQCLLSMNDQDGSPFYADSRQVLKRVLRHFEKDKLQPVIALELEFYLIDRNLLPNGHPQAPLIPGSPHRYSDTQLLSLVEMQDFEAVFTAIEVACKALNIPAETVLKENSPGQFELNLYHQSDALLAADQAFLLKRLIKGCAQQHGFIATFMAKPFAQWAGNGMHIHASVLDHAGENIFKLSERTPRGAYANAIAGLIEGTSEMLAFYAPHANSYRRLVEGVTMAPTTLSWGYENRTALIRLPLANPAATRIEHRLAGADANPYLVAATTLAGIHHGISTQPDLTAETVGDAHSQHPAALAISWQEAVARVSRSGIAKNYFGEQFTHCFDRIKNAELNRFGCTITDFEYNSYLRHV
jgi:glutamine synthetase